MLCPVSGQPLVIVEWNGVELDFSIDGHGIWFDADELRHLFAAAGAPDRANTLESRLKVLPHLEEYGPKRRCPRCSARMDHVADDDRADVVILDSCPHGHGLWFDRGELERIIAAEFDADDPELAVVRSYLLEFMSPAGSVDPATPTESADPTDRAED